LIKMLVYNVLYSRFQMRNGYLARIRLALCWCTQWREMCWTSSCFRISAGLAVILTPARSVQANARIVTWKLSWPFLTNSYQLTVHDLVIFNFHNVCSKSSYINYPGIHKIIFFKFNQVNCCCQFAVWTVLKSEVSFTKMQQWYEIHNKLLHSPLVKSQLCLFYMNLAILNEIIAIMKY
jgi:hypothetical protein